MFDTEAGPPRHGALAGAPAPGSAAAQQRQRQQPPRPGEIIRAGDPRLALRVHDAGSGFEAMKETMKEMGYNSDDEYEGFGEADEDEAAAGSAEQPLPDIETGGDAIDTGEGVTGAAAVSDGVGDSADAADGATSPWLTHAEKVALARVEAKARVQAQRAAALEEERRVGRKLVALILLASAAIAGITAGVVISVAGPDEDNRPANAGRRMQELARQPELNDAAAGLLWAPGRPG